MASPTLAHVHIGQADLWVGGTPPAAGSDPNDPTTSAVNSMVSGGANPTSAGTYVGFTSGPSTLTYKPTYYLVISEQALSEILVVPTAEEATLDFMMLELSYNNLQTGLGQSTTKVNLSGVTYQANFVGSKQAISTNLLVAYSRKRVASTGYYIASLYSVYTQDGVALNLERRKETQMKAIMKCLADTTRPYGDQLYQYVEYNAAA